MLNDAIVDGSKFCAPIALSAVTGLTTKQVAKFIRATLKYKSVKGVKVKDLASVIEHFGFDYDLHIMNPCDSMSVFDWVNKKRTLRDDECRPVVFKKNKTYIICVKSHVFALKGEHVACSSKMGVKSKINSIEYKDHDILCIWELDDRLPDFEGLKSIFDEEANQKKKVYSINASNKRKALKLAEKHGLTIDDSFYRDCGLVCLFGPDEVTKRVLAAAGRSYYFEGWGEVCKAIESTFELQPV